MVVVVRKIEIILLHSKQQNLFEFGACFYLDKSFLKFSIKQKKTSQLPVILQFVLLKFTILKNSQ